MFLGKRNDDMKKRKSIAYLMTLIFTVTIGVEIVVLLSVLYIGKVPTKIKQEAYANFDINVIDNVNNIQNLLNTNEHFDHVLLNISYEIDKHFGRKEALVSSSKMHQLDFLKQIPNYLISLLIATNANGAYIILENLNTSNGTQVKEGLYITTNQGKNLSSYEAKIISNEIIELEKYITINRFSDSFVIDLNNQNYRFYNVIKNTKKQNINNPYISYRYQNFFSENVINVSYPIIENDTLVAIIGIEFKESSILKSNLRDSNISYVLGYTRDSEREIIPILTWNETRKLNIGEKILIDDKKVDNKYYKLINNDDYVINLINLNFYKDNVNPYNEESWVFLGIIKHSDLVGVAKYVERFILIIIVFSFFFGSLMIYLFTKKITSPIKVLSAEVSRGNTDFSNLKKTNIEEINNLIVSFDKLTQDIMQYSNKLTNAINSFLLGIYFYHNNEDEVFCTQPFFEMCGSKLKEGYIKRSEFEKLFNMLLNSYYDEKYDAYQLASGRWVKIDHKIESTFTIGIVSDITENVIALRKMEEKLDIDGLTQIYNRNAFGKLANKILEENKDRVVAVIMWDIDRLKYINDRYGHEFGDRYIITFANIIKTLENDGGIVARRSGDEFFGIIAGDSKEEIEEILKNVTNKIATLELDVKSGIKEKIRASMGVAWYKEDGNDLLTLLECADNHLYQYKFEFGDSATNANRASVNVFHYKKELAKIIDGDYITFAYQPIVDVKKAEIIGYEMLMRIFSDIINTPKHLIGLAKQYDNLNNIETLTFKKSLESYNLYKENIKNKKIFINSIARENLSLSVLEEIKTLTNNNLEMMVVELTEILDSDENHILEKVNKLKELKAQVAIDNFTKTYLETLKLNYKVDYLKVDISLIKNIDSSIEKQKELKQIVGFAKANNYKVIAVGINRLEELKTVIELGIDYVQGYFLGEPTVKPTVLKDEVIKYLKEYKNKI